MVFRSNLPTARSFVRIDPGEDSPARRLAAGAMSFLRAAELLHQDDPESWGWTTCFVNIGFAVELGLKAFLRAYGATEGEQRAIGHDLTKAYALAVEQGFRPSHPLQKVLADDLTPHLQDMRYLTGEWIELPPIGEAIQVTRLLVLDVHGQCGFIRKT